MTAPIHVPSGRHRLSAARPRLRSVVFAGVAGTGFLLAALTVASYLQAAFGLRTVLLALLMAVLPLFIVVPTFLWLDRYEPEPRRYLVAAFLWGAAISTIIAATINTSALAVFHAATTDQDVALATTAVFVAPFVEEAAKGAFVLFMWWFVRREFDGLIDGMVYAGITAAGFAFTENIQYLAQAYSEGGGSQLTATFVGRGLMTPFAHPIFTVMTGIGIGIASVSRSWLVKIGAPVFGYLLAAIAHSLWNLAATLGGEQASTIYLIIELPIFCAWVALIAWARSREGRLIGIFLRPYADAGWLTGAEAQMLGSMPRRRQARRWARLTGGRARLNAMVAFQDAASELALLRRRMVMSHADAQALEVERDLLVALDAQRRAFAAGTGAPVPV